MTTNYMYNESENETWQQTGQITDSKQMLIMIYYKLAKRPRFEREKRPFFYLFLIRPGRWGGGGTVDFLFLFLFYIF